MGCGVVKQKVRAKVSFNSVPAKKLSTKTLGPEIKFRREAGDTSSKNIGKFSSNTSQLHVLTQVDKDIEVKRKQSMMNGVQEMNQEFKQMQDQIIIEKKSFIHKNNDPIGNNYEIRQKIGSGSYGTVYKVIHKRTGVLRAMKVIKKKYVNSDNFSEDSFQVEISVLIDTDHPNIMRIYEFFADSTYFYIIMEYIRGKDLMTYISQMKIYSEELVSIILKQLLSAVCYLHSKQIVHRDIKPENIMIKDSRQSQGNGQISHGDLQLVLIDFGNSNYYSNCKLKSIVGTPYYISPEVLNENYTEKCDVWSCGIILYFMLYGYPPFKGKSMSETFSKIMTEDINFGNGTRIISEVSLDLLKKMLEKDPSNRISAEEAFKHPFLNQKKTEALLSQKTVSDFFCNVQNFYFREKLQQATISYIVHYNLSKEDFNEFENVFKKFDINGDGRLSIAEIKEGFEQLYGNILSNVELEKILEKMDMDKDHFVEYQEFLRVAMNSSMLISESNLKSAFEGFDSDHDGYLDKQEIKQVLGQANDAYLTKLVAILDENGDGKINFEEFSHFMGIISTK